MNSIEEPLLEFAERLFPNSPLAEDSLEVRRLGMMTPEARVGSKGARNVTHRWGRLNELDAETLARFVPSFRRRIKNLDFIEKNTILINGRGCFCASSRP
jgi:hypothetical protein